MIVRSLFVAACFLFSATVSVVGQEEHPREFDAAAEAFIASDYERLVSIDNVDDVNVLLVQARAARALGEQYFERNNLSDTREDVEDTKQLQIYYTKMRYFLARGLQASKSEAEKVSVLTLWLSTLKPKWARTVDKTAPELSEALELRLERRLGDAGQERLAYQSQIIREIVGGILINFPMDSRRNIAKLFQEEYEDIYSTPVETSRFLKIVHDLPLFVTVYSDWFRKHGIEPSERTVRWHLWLATSQLLPSDSERLAIREQEKLFAEDIRRLTLHFQGDEQLAQQEMDAWLDFYDQIEGNVFWPYFKSLANEEAWAYIRSTTQNLCDTHLQPHLDLALRQAGQEEDKKSANELMQQTRKDILRVARYFYASGHFKKLSPTTIGFLPNRYRVKGSSDAPWRDTFLINYSVDRIQEFDVLVSVDHKSD